MEYSQEELEAAFHSVCDKKDWKKPINAIIPLSKLEVVEAAIPYFTGTKAEVYFSDNSRKNGLVRVQSIGYRNGPCGDH